MRKRSPSEPPGAYDTALGLLARREHSARELKRKLFRRGHAVTEAEEALGALKRADYQDDGRFAAALARKRIAAGYGPAMILAELRSHGIAREAAEPVLEGIDWLEQAVALARRRGRLATDTDGRRRLAQWLSQRGFPADAVRGATRVDPEAD